MPPFGIAILLRRCAWRWIVCLWIGLLSAASPATEAIAEPAPAQNSDLERQVTPYPFAEAVDRLKRAVEAEGLRVVAEASASIGAAQQGITIPGNAVIMVFRNDYARRLLLESEAAGYEAPLRFYVTEAPNGLAILQYRLPSHVLAPYGAGAMRIGRELDPIFAAIAARLTQ